MDGKRLTDLLLASLLLILLSPVLLAGALVVWGFDGRPILFAQDRIGLLGRPFRILKFRTMRPSAGPLVTASGDSRITSLGRTMRRWKLDELPQLWNVLRGDMSFVGPRPEVPHYVERYRRGFAGIENLRPGITDWSSLIFRDEERVLAAHSSEPSFYERVLLPRKLALARLYQRHRSWLLDLRLMGATGLLMLGAESLGQQLAGRALFQQARNFKSDRQESR